MPGCQNASNREGAARQKPVGASHFKLSQALGIMRRQKRKPIEKISVAHEDLPSHHPNAWHSVVFVERFEGEVTSDLLKAVLMAAIEAAGGDQGLGLSEGGAELRLKSGEVLEAVWFGPKKKEMNEGAHLFARQTGRMLATYDGSGHLRLASGELLCSSNSEAFHW